jgi:hypothetical protein
MQEENGFLYKRGRHEENFKRSEVSSEEFFESRGIDGKGLGPVVQCSSRVGRAI